MANHEKTMTDEQTFEESLAELHQIVNDLEDGTLGLEEALGRYERAIGLLKQCYSTLETAEQKIELLIGIHEDGSPEMEDFDATATFDDGGEGKKAPARQKRKTKKKATKKPATSEDEEDVLF